MPSNGNKYGTVVTNLKSPLRVTQVGATMVPYMFHNRSHTQLDYRSREAFGLLVHSVLNINNNMPEAKQHSNSAVDELVFDIHCGYSKGICQPIKLWCKFTTIAARFDDL